MKTYLKIGLVACTALMFVPVFAAFGQDTQADNKQVIHHLVEAFNDRDREAFDNCYADEIIVHSRSGDRTLNHEEHWEEVEATFETFPDFKAKLLGIVAEDDHVFIYWAYSGTDSGEGINGIKPTGKHATWWAFSDYRLENSKIVEAWQIHDSYDMLRQLGLVSRPTP